MAKEHNLKLMCLYFELPGCAGSGRLERGVLRHHADGPAHQRLHAGGRGPPGVAVFPRKDAQGALLQRGRPASAEEGEEPTASWKSLQGFWGC